MTPLPSPARCPSCGTHNKFTVHVRHNGQLVCKVCRGDIVSSSRPTVEDASLSPRQVLREGALPLQSADLASAPSRLLFRRIW